VVPTPTAEQHWQVALSALAAGYQTPNPIAMSGPGLSAWSALLARSWPQFRQWMDPVLETQLRQQVTGLGGNTVFVRGIRGLAIDTAAAPSLAAAGPNAAVISLPAPLSSWTVSFHADVEVLSLGSSPILMDVEVIARDVRVSTRLDMDFSDPVRPSATGSGTPSIDLRLELRSSSPLLGAVLTPLTSVLDPVIRTALLGGSIAGRQQLTALLTQIPAASFGQGGPGVTALANAPDLEAVAAKVSAEVRRHHLPFKTLLNVFFTDPGYGNGTPRAYKDHGDSAIWTGHYVASEALRYEVTGEPAALLGMTRALEGLELCLDVGGHGGLLARCVIPLTSPHSSSIVGGSRSFIGTVRGVDYAAIEDISRDQYIGAMLGFLNVYLRVPAQRARAGQLIDRVATYLDQNDWVARRQDGVTISAPFTQTPAVLWSFIKCGNLVNPARFGALHDQSKGLSAITWLAVWTSTREVMESYYKFNLLHSNMSLLTTSEVDPTLYREYVKGLEIAHDAVGHHLNAWFDTVYAKSIPTRALAAGPVIQAELEAWTLRDRRSHPTSNSQDPAIQSTLYSSPFLINNAGAQLHVAAHPLPIEKRVHGDFLWQTHPFELDGGQGDPTLQHPGVDLLLPYWTARAYDLFR
jgi:hypothetical protein